MTTNFIKYGVILSVGILLVVWLLSTMPPQTTVQTTPLMDSQGDQSDFIDYFFSRVKANTQTYVEFGFNSFDYTGGSGANTVTLYNRGWSGLLMDGSSDNPKVNLHKEWMCSNNIVKLFEKYNVKKDVDYISIDIDSNDIWLMEQILLKGYRPQLMSIEYNPHFPNYSYLALKDKCDRLFECRAFGASMGAIVMMANVFGYEIVYVTHGLDIFLTPSENIVKLDENFKYRVHNQLIPSHTMCTAKWRDELVDVKRYIDETYKLSDKVIKSLILDA